MDNIQIMATGVGLLLLVLSIVSYVCSTIRSAGDNVRDAIALQTQAIERHTSFVHRECERERMARLQTPQGESILPPPPRVPSFSDVEMRISEPTAQGYRNTQRRL